MNRVVVAQELLVVSSVASAVGRFDEPSQRCEILGRCTIGDDVRDAALDRFTGLEHVQNIIEPDRRHDGPPPWQHREFSQSGSLLFNADFPAGVNTYRAYRFQWNPSARS
jgi:hypothetical protein